MGDGANHWSAWLTSDEEVRLVTSPMVATICHALTVGWLRPTLELLDGQDPRRFMVWLSTDNLSLRPDKSQDARALHDAGILSEGAVLRENGFNPDEDAADDDEKAKRWLVTLMLAKPEYAQAILDYLGVDIDLPTAPAAPVEPPDSTARTAPTTGNPRTTSRKGKPRHPSTTTMRSRPDEHNSCPGWPG